MIPQSMKKSRLNNFYPSLHNKYNQTLNYALKSRLQIILDANSSWLIGRYFEAQLDV